jgi:DNA-binding NtrC family response regulator
MAARCCSLQTKLRQFLEEKTLRRVGGSQDIRVNVRVIAASNRDLGQEVAGHRFRKDLFYRLNVLPITMPALRTRPEDIPFLVEHFIEGFDTEFRKRVRGVTPAARTMLQQYQWPGNVRELRNVIERAMLLSDNDQLDAPDFPSLSGTASGVYGLQLPSTGVDLEKLERSLVIQALRRSGGNQTRAGSLLGLNRDQVRYRIEKFGLHSAGVAFPNR